MLSRYLLKLASRPPRLLAERLPRGISKSIHATVLRQTQWKPGLLQVSTAWVSTSSPVQHRTSLETLMQLSHLKYWCVVSSHNSHPICSPKPQALYFQLFLSHSVILMPAGRSLRPASAACLFSADRSHSNAHNQTPHPVCDVCLIMPRPYGDSPSGHFLFEHMQQGCDIPSRASPVLA